MAANEVSDLRCGGPARRAARPRAPASPTLPHGDTALFARYRNPRDPLDRDAVVERLPRTSDRRPLPAPRGAVRRRLPGRVLRPRQGGRPLRPGPPDHVLELAVPTIVGEIKRYFRDRAWSVRVRRELQERALRVERVVGELTRESGRQPSVEEVARSIGIEAEDVLEAMQAAGAYRATSLDAPRPATRTAARSATRSAASRRATPTPSTARCCRPSCARSRCASATSSGCASSTT